MLSLNTNLSAMIGLAAMNRNGQAVARSLEHLATGQKVNRASDDPAGMIAGEKMAAELKDLSKKIERETFEDKRIGAVEGAQSVYSDLLVELKGLVQSSANTGGLSQAELKANQEEADSILHAMDHLAATSTFDGDLIVSSLTSKGLGLDKLALGGEQNLVSGDLEKADASISSAIDTLDGMRSGAGMRQKEIASNLRQFQEQFQNVSEARSQIMDTDYAAETAEYVRASMLRDVSTFVTGLAMKQSADMVMTLLKPLGYRAAA
jgi:flagellin-like hook-associated protein FlgL